MEAESGERIRISNAKLALLRRLCRGIETFLDPDTKAELQFCYRTGYLNLATADSLSDIFEASDPEAKSIIEEWVSEGPVEALPPMPERNPELEARVQRLKRDFEDREYRRMTANISGGPPKTEKEDLNMGCLGAELKTIQRHMFAIINMVLTVAGSFAFGYLGTGYVVEDPVAPVKLMVGLTIASVVFFADLYFIVKMVDTDNT